MSIVLTGATGNTGSVIAQRLKSRGVPFVAMARSAANRARLEADGIATVYGDFDSPDTLVPALRGARAAYVVCTPDEHMARREIAFVDACKEAGVRRVVKCSAYLAGADGPTNTLRLHGDVERHLAASGLEWTSLRPTGFMQTFTLMGWDLIQKAGVVQFAAGDGGLPLIDVRDVATVAVMALTESGHDGKIYDLTGPENLTWHDQAEILERVLGRPVSYLPGSERSLVVLLKLMGVGPNSTEHALTITRLIRERRLETVSPTLRDLGIEPTTYEQFVRDYVSGATGGGNSYEAPGGVVFRVMGAIMPAVLRARMAVMGRPQRPVKPA